MEPIYDIDPATGERRGAYAIDPSGHLITLGRTQSIKDGFRYATQDDVDAKQGKPAPIVEVEIEPAPLPPAEIEIDPSPSDQD